MNGIDITEEELAEKVREALDGSVAELDGRTVERLCRARLAAVASAGTERPRWRFAVPRWVTVWSIAVFAALVVAVSLWVAVPRHDQFAGHVEDMEILTAQEHLEIYEDMDFYRWLASNQNVR